MRLLSLTRGGVVSLTGVVPTFALGEEIDLPHSGLKASRRGMAQPDESIFGIGIDRSAAALVAFLEGKATSSASPPDTVLPKIL
jgi:hypothetical protein